MRLCRARRGKKPRAAPGRDNCQATSTTLLITTVVAAVVARVIATVVAAVVATARACRSYTLYSGSTAPTMSSSRKAVQHCWGAKAKRSAPAYRPPGGFAVNQQREIIVKQLLIVLFASAAVITSANAHGWKQQHVCHQHGAYGYHCHP